MPKKNVSAFAVFLVTSLLFLAGTAAAGSDITDSLGQDKSGFYYTIQKGDTLWDLSRKFYNSQWDWPGLWEMNDRIKNPHLIYPGKRIRVFLKKEKELERIAQKEIPKKEEITPTFSYPKMDNLGFIKRTAVSPLGNIIRSVKDDRLISENDAVYIESSGADRLVPGTTYRIYVTRQIEREYHGQPFEGVLHTVKGAVEVTGAKEGYYTGKITESFAAVHPGDLLMGYTQRSGEIPVKEDPPEIQANLVCNDNDDALMAENSVAYMNRGSSDRVRPGDMYTVYRNPDAAASTFRGDTEIEFDPEKVGRLIVLHTEDISSTVIIVKNAKDMVVEPGLPVR
ncbi:MAG: LysM peptidoglycan-binding domain-containing protein [Desulfarculaceae bacterium]|nr:LysM peptidoglycan-binding domain-containing protein [Desulfarculaceae bacterium]